MNNGTKSLSINETFIIEPVDGVEVYSACTAFYTNNLISCSGNTELIMGIGGVSTNLAFSAVTFYGDGSNLTGISTQDTYITGGTYSAGTTRLFDSSGNTITIGGYFTPSDDIYVSGLTFNTSNYDLTVKRNDGVNFTQSLSILASDLTITGGTYNPSTGTATFTNNTGGTFNVTGFLTGFTDIFVTGATFNNDNLRLTRNDNNNINVVINKFDSLTANTISATTYENLPIKYYAEFSGSPSVKPIVYSANSIAIGDGAEALNEHMFVVGQYAGGGASDSFSSVFLGQEAGNQATNSYQSNFIGYYAGNQSYDSYSSNFIGTQAGLSTSSSYSNFIGDYTGAGSVGNDSNLIGNQAGYGAQHNTVNFIGYYAGWAVVDSVDTNFIGNGAGASANYVSSSNFIGSNSGYGADYVTDTNFIGPYAGYLSNNISSSNFFGSYAGYQGDYNSNSNFIGPDAGNSTNYAEGSNFIGYSSGYQANNTTNSNFIGSSAGGQATYTSGSTFIGGYAGASTNNIKNSNFIGNSAGLVADNSNYSNFIGEQAGKNAIDSSNSNFIGRNAGINTINTSGSTFIGWNAGNNADNAKLSNFIGVSAGSQATNASGSTFIGYRTGNGATNANNSVFIGSGIETEYDGVIYDFPTGYQAINSSGSTFIGFSTGYQATDASYSNFLGYYAGFNTTNASYSNFIGSSAGSQATNASSSNFIGTGAGANAANASNSNFIGYGVGESATGATFSTLIGFNVGRANNYDKSNTIGRNNIVIGTSISLPPSTQNSINIGGVLFGSNTYFNSNSSTNPFTGASSTGRIGVNVAQPTHSLHVSGNTRLQGGLTASTISATTYQNLSINLSGLSNVTLSSQTNNDVLTYNSSSQIWQNKTVVDALGYTPVSDLQIRRRGITIFDDFTGSGNGVSPFVKSTFNSGTIATSTFFDENNQGVVVISSVSGATNGGANILLNNTATARATSIAVGMEFDAIIRISTTLSNVVSRFGIINGTTNTTMPSDGIYFEVSGSTLIGQTANGSVRSSTSSYSPLLSGTFYHFRLIMTSASLATYQLYDMGGTLLWTSTLSTNLPTVGNGCQPGLIAWNNVAEARQLFQIDYIGFSYPAMNRGALT